MRPSPATAACQPVFRRAGRLRDCDVVRAYKPGPASLARGRKRLRHVRILHESEADRDSGEAVGNPLDLDALVLGCARRIGGDDGEDDVVLVQHLVVLEVMQQRGRREIRIAGEEHRGAGHDVRRLLFQVADQRVDRHFDPARLLNKNAASTLPGDDQQNHEGTEQNRQPRTIEQLDLQYVAGGMALAPNQEFAELFDDLALRVPLLREVNGDGLEGPQAQLDNDPGTELVIRHLHNLGHQRVFIIAGPEGWFSTSKRLQTAVSEASKLGMAITGVQHGDWSAASGFTIARNEPFNDGTTAIIAANDEMAMGALAALDKRGIHVPGDMSVTGYDDVRGAPYFKPALTSIHVDFKAKGELAIARLLALIAQRGEGPDEVPPEVVVRPQLMVRESTAAIS